MIFKYKGKNKSGEDLKGEISARTKEEAVDILSHQEILPIEIIEISKIRSSFGSNAGAKVSFKQKYLFSRQLSNLIKSGVPILRAIEIILNQTSNACFAEVLRATYQGIKDGRNFSDCLSDYPGIFSPFYISMISVGEEGGNLKDTLLSVSEYQKKQQQIISKIRTALVYPIFMAITGLATVVFILTFVMPNIAGLFKNIGQELPFITRFLMSISQGMRAGWFVIIPLACLIIFSAMRWAQSSLGKRVLDGFKLKVPIVKTVILKVELGRFCRTLELLLKSGVSLLGAIRVAVRTLDNSFVKEEILKSSESLSSGESLADSFMKCRYASSMMINLIKVGEESGLLEETLHDIADTYEQEADEFIQTLMTILEPAMILAVGGVVGVVIIAMMLPIFQMDMMVG